MPYKLMSIVLALLTLPCICGCESKSVTVASHNLPEKRTGNPNLDYWLFLNAEFTSLRALNSNEGGEPQTGLPDDFLKQSFVHKLLRASGEDVDPELVAWALKVVNYYSESSVWSSFMAQLAVEDRALQIQLVGEPRRLWLAATMGSNLFSMDRTLREEGESLRQTLNAKYGHEFPPSTF